MIIGITGTDGAGKGTVVEYLVSQKGYVLYHARALFVEEILKRGIEPSRANMRLVANELRRDHGNDVIVTMFLKQAHDNGDSNVVIDSIRALAEAETLKREGGILLAVDADSKLRYERVVARQSSSDNVTYAEFEAQEKLEMDDPDPNGMQKVKVMASADHTISNDGTLEELHQKIDLFLESIS